MSYDHKLLLEQISGFIHHNPCCSLQSLAAALHVSRRTIQQIIILSTGKTLTEFREEILIVEVKALFATQPSSSIKEISFDLGFKSPRSFSRAIRRACGICPEQFRAEQITNAGNMSTC